MLPVEVAAWSEAKVWVTRSIEMLPVEVRTSREVSLLVSGTRTEILPALAEAFRLVTSTLPTTTVRLDSPPVPETTRVPLAFE
jgi:hypothetical protein